MDKRGWRTFTIIILLAFVISFVLIVFNDSQNLTGAVTGAPCREQWVCSPWSECVSGQKVRICHDVNQCEDKLERGIVGSIVRSPKPNVTQECPKLPSSCEDGVMNQDETDIDCGGSCDPCLTGKNCDLNEDCVSGICFEGKCVECIVDGHCPENNVCKDNSCEVELKEVIKWTQRFATNMGLLTANTASIFSLTADKIMGVLGAGSARLVSFLADYFKTVDTTIFAYLFLGLIIALIVVLIILIAKRIKEHVDEHMGALLDKMKDLIKDGKLREANEIYKHMIHEYNKNPRKEDLKKVEEAYKELKKAAT